MNKKTALVPRLRFAEFLNDGEWKGKRLGQLLTIGNGRDYKHLSDGNIPVYGSGGYMRSVNDYLYDGESVCIGRKGTINKPIFLSGKFWTVDTLFYTHSYVDFIPKFAYNVFQKIDWLKYNEAGGVPSLSKTTIEKIKVFIPKEISEQQRIADCLSSLDHLITAEYEKLNALKAHKKGLMQKLFPTEGKTVPEWRFPEFRGKGEWEERKFGDVCPSIASGKSKKSTANGIYPLMGSTGQIGLCDTADYSGDLILIARVGANAGQVNHFIGECGVSDNTLILVVDATNINGSFLRKWLENFNINKLIFGSGQPLVTSGQLKNIEMCVPELNEQQKIADCLSSVDELITAQTEKTEALKAHKKGLMQGLFPSAQEVGI